MEGIEHSIDDLRLLALSRKGKCLSPKFLGLNTELEWECAKGHRWFAKPSEVLKGSWCQMCLSKNSKTIKDMHRLAERFGGKCLSKVYINKHSSLHWMCQNRHQFLASYYELLEMIGQGYFCAKCYEINRGKEIIRKLKQIALSKNGQCLSDEYISPDHLMIWKCDKNHQFELSLTDIENNKWCYHCENQKLLGKAVQLSLF